MRRLGLVFAAVLVSLAAACAGRGGSGTVPPLQPLGTQSGHDRVVMISRRIAIDTVTGVTLHGMLARPDPAHELTPDTPLPAQLPLISYGGPVQTSPKLYFVFWGSQWLSSAPGAPATATGPGDPDNLRQYAKNFTTAAAGSKWLNDVLQYTQPGGLAAGNPVTLRDGSWTDTSSSPPAIATTAQLDAEALKAAKYFGAAGPNVNIVILLPNGVGATNYVGNPGAGGGWCAYHTWMTNAHNVYVPYTVLPYLPDASFWCGENEVNAGTAGTLDGVSIVLGHEIAETITDPEPSAGLTGATVFPTGWMDANGDEVGDKCARIVSGVGAIVDNTYAGNFPTQSLWDNSHMRCRQGPPTP